VSESATAAAIRATARILKANPNRTVFLEQRAGSGAVVVKRYHAASALRRPRDRGRARREQRVLARLHAAGLPVPEPLGIRRRDGCWELSCAWIPDAVSLHDLVDGRLPWPRPRAELAAALGRLLARLHTAGLDHGDLHPGNVLIDAGGRPWLVDCAKARLRRRLGAPLLVRDLVRLAAGVREHLSARFRARFLVAWLRALSPELCARLPARAPLVEGVERLARERRRSVAARNRARWRRASGVCRLVQDGGARALEAREPLRPDEIVIRRPATLEQWADSGLAWDHRLPCARPLRFPLDPRSAATFALPAGSRPLDGTGAEGARARRIHLGAGALLGALRDRGLALARPPAAEDLWTDGRGALLLGPGPRLVARAPGDDRTVPEGIPAPVGRRERALFALGYLRAHLGTRAERAALREELLGG